MLSSFRIIPKRHRHFFTWTKTAPPQQQFVPMIESPIPAMRLLAQQYAASGRGCGNCTKPKTFSCPKCGFPTHCSEDCYNRDTPHQAYVKDLRTIYEDMVDLRSGRKFPEFEFPGPQQDWQRADITNWIAFLTDRMFQSPCGRIGSARGANQAEIEARSIRHISSVFTYPLTIAHAVFWHGVLGDPSKLGRKNADGNLIPWRIAILGPRAEATLPLRSWLELCAIFPDAAFDLHLVGPDVPEAMHEKVEEINDNRLTITWTRGLYQDTVEYHDAPDLFVLFNSGVGHGSLEETWRDALDVVFNKSAFRPAIFTSHSKEDAARDHGYLGRRQDCKYLVRPAENPFMSFRKDAAVNNLRYIINSNHTYAVLRGAPPDGLVGGSLLDRLRLALR